MNEIIYNKQNDGYVSMKNANKRGAQVYGVPISKELASYLDDVAPDAAQTRALTMFFAGKFQPMTFTRDDDDDPDGDF